MEQGTRVGLGPIDRLVLLAAWLVSCAAVYGLGFYTGSYTQDRLAGEEDRVVRLPDPPPVGQRPKSGDDLSFLGQLESSGPRSKPGEDIPARPAPAPGLAAVPAPPSRAKTAAADRAGRPTPKTTTKPGTAAPAGKRSVAKASPAPAKVSPRQGSTVARASAPAAAGTPRPPPAPAKPAPRAQPTGTASVAKSAAPAVAPRRAAPPRKAPPPAREASAAAD
jgi:hypothetical protein